MKRTKTLFFTLVFTLLTVSAGVTFADGRTGGDTDGGDILVFDILGVFNGTTSTDASRPAGGGSGGGDILVFDIVG